MKNATWPVSQKPFALMSDLASLLVFAARLKSSPVIGVIGLERLNANIFAYFSQK